MAALCRVHRLRVARARLQPHDVRVRPPVLLRVRGGLEDMRVCPLWAREEQLYAERGRVAAEVAEQREALRWPLAAQEVAAVLQRVRQVFEHKERHG